MFIAVLSDFTIRPTIRPRKSIMKCYIWFQNSGSDQPYDPENQIWNAIFNLSSVYRVMLLLGQGLLGQGENGELSSSHKCDIINLVPINRSMTSSKEWEMNLDRNWENRHIIKYFLIKHAKNEMNKCFVVYITILNTDDGAGH